MHGIQGYLYLFVLTESLYTKFLVAVLLCVIPVAAIAQPAKYSNEFLNVGVGARSIGMGKAFVATANDVTASYWNPAGLVKLSGNYQAGLMHAQYFAGIAKFDYVGVAGKLDKKSAIGVSVLRYGVDDIPNTTELIDGEGNINYDRMSKFSVADYAMMISYSRSSYIDGLDLGGNLKIIRRLTGEFASAWGFGIDAAVRYSYEDWVIGTVIRDATSTFNVWQFNEDKLTIGVSDSVFNLPPENSLEITLPRLYMGVARTFSFSGKISLVAEVNASLSFSGKSSSLISTSFAAAEPVAGIEISYGGLVYFRTGLGNLQRITEFGAEKRLTADPSAGIGLHLGNLYIDYAMSNISPQNIKLYSNIFSVRYVFSRDDG